MLLPLNKHFNKSQTFIICLTMQKGEKEQETVWESEHRLIKCIRNLPPSAWAGINVGLLAHEVNASGFLSPNRRTGGALQRASCLGNNNRAAWIPSRSASAFSGVKLTTPLKIKCWQHNSKANLQKLPLEVITRFTFALQNRLLHYK